MKTTSSASASATPDGPTPPPPQPLGPFRLVTVNTAPERAKKVIGRVVEDLKDKCTIIYESNIETIDGVKAVVEDVKPDILFTASMWTPEEAGRIVQIAKGVVPHLRTFSIPQGLQVERGPDGVVEYLKEQLPAFLGV